MKNKKIAFHERNRFRKRIEMISNVPLGARIVNDTLDLLEELGVENIDKRSILSVPGKEVKFWLPCSDGVLGVQILTNSDLSRSPASYITFRRSEQDRIVFSITPFSKGIVIGEQHVCSSSVFSNRNEDKYSRMRADIVESIKSVHRI